MSWPLEFNKQNLLHLYLCIIKYVNCQTIANADQIQFSWQLASLEALMEVMVRLAVTATTAEGFLASWRWYPLLVTCRRKHMPHQRLLEEALCHENYEICHGIAAASCTLRFRHGQILGGILPSCLPQGIKVMTWREELIPKISCPLRWQEMVLWGVLTTWATTCTTAGVSSSSLCSSILLRLLLHIRLRLLCVMILSWGMLCRECGSGLSCGHPIHWLRQWRLPATDWACRGLVGWSFTSR